VFWALLESVNGVEAQPARVDAAVINNVAPRIRAAFAFCAIGIPNSRIRTTTLYATEPLEVKSVHRRRAARHDPLPSVVTVSSREPKSANKLYGISLARLFGAAKVKMHLARSLWGTPYAPVLDQMASAGQLSGEWLLNRGLASFVSV
jgi:hypothetical protein